jgi:hypothetical protein
MHLATARYIGPDMEGAQSTGEILRTGDTVRILGIRVTLTAGRIAQVDLPSDAYGTGDTYTVWSIPARDLDHTWRG